MLLGVLARERVHLTEAADGDEEGLVLGQPDALKLNHLVAQVRLELVDVRRADRGPATDEAAPGRDASLDARLSGCRCVFGAHAGAPPPASCPGWMAVSAQIWRSASLTTRHCWLCSASAARPSVVSR